MHPGGQTKPADVLSQFVRYFHFHLFRQHILEPLLPHLFTAEYKGLVMLCRCVPGAFYHIWRAFAKYTYQRRCLYGTVHALQTRFLDDVRAGMQPAAFLQLYPQPMQTYVWLFGSPELVEQLSPIWLELVLRELAELGEPLDFHFIMLVAQFPQWLWMLSEYVDDVCIADVNSWLSDPVSVMDGKRLFSDSQSVVHDKLFYDDFMIKPMK